MPKTLVSDNGSNFTSQILAYLCKQWKIQQRFTSPYHPQSNLTERANRTIKTMIRTYFKGEPYKYWAKYIPFLALAINSSKQESTGFAPSNLLLNRSLNLPFDVANSPKDSEIRFLLKNYSHVRKYISFDRTEQYSKMIDFVKINLEKAKQRQKEGYDARRREEKFQVGDRVLLKDETLSSAADGVVAGLTPLYRSDVATVTRVTGDLTYEIQFEEGTSKSPIYVQQLRRFFDRPDRSRSNLLLTCNFDRDTIIKHQLDAGNAFSDIYKSDEFVKFFC
jgi:hypothetical protein